MPELSDRPVGAPRGERLVLLFQVAGLLLTGWLMWRATVGLQWARVPLPWLILRATVYALAACLAGALITVIVYMSAAAGEYEDYIRASFRGSAAAVWFAPSVILLTQLSPAFIVPALVLVVNATHMLYTQWSVSQGPPAEIPRSAGLFAAVQLPERRFWKEMGPALAVSFTVQMGTSAVMFHHAGIAGIAFTAGTALLTILALGSRAIVPKPPSSMPRSFLALALTVLLAIGLTIGGLIPNFMRGSDNGGSGGNSAGSSPPGMPGAGPENLPPASAAGLADGGGFPGVILWPEIKPIPTLIAPTPPTSDGSFVPALVRPLSIPFSGEYWMFRWPYARPPNTSFFQRGSPSKLAFSSTDRQPIQMEAHHKLDQPIALSCCSAIRIEIGNADRYRGTISLELILIDNESPGSRWITLGRYPVTSMPDLRRDPVIPVSETLDFPISEAAASRSFDEFKIVFERARWRTDKSARVAIDRFILVPRM